MSPFVNKIILKLLFFIISTPIVTLGQDFYNDIKTVTQLRGEKEYDRAIKECKSLRESDGYGYIEHYLIDKQLGELYTYTNLDSSYLYLSFALKQLEEHPKDTTGRSEQLYCNSLLGEIAKTQFKFKESQNHQFKALEIFNTIHVKSKNDSLNYADAILSLSNTLKTGNLLKPTKPLGPYVIEFITWPEIYWSYQEKVESNYFIYLLNHNFIDTELSEYYKNVYSLEAKNTSTFEKSKAIYYHSMLSNSDIIKAYNSISSLPTSSFHDSLSISSYFEELAFNYFNEDSLKFIPDLIAHTFSTRVNTPKNILNLGINLYNLKNYEYPNFDLSLFVNEFLTLSKNIVKDQVYDPYEIEILKYISWISDKYSIDILASLNNYKSSLDNVRDSINFFKLKSSIEDKQGLIKDKILSDQELLNSYLGLQSLNNFDSLSIYYSYISVAQNKAALESIELLKKAQKYNPISTQWHNPHEAALSIYTSIGLAFHNLNKKDSADLYFAMAETHMDNVPAYFPKLIHIKNKALFHSYYNDIDKLRSSLQVVENIKCYNKHCLEQKELTKLYILRYIYQIQGDANRYYETVKRRIVISRNSNYTNVKNGLFDDYHSMTLTFGNKDEASCFKYIDSLEYLITNFASFDTRVNQLAILTAKINNYRIYGHYDKLIASLKKKKEYVIKEFGLQSEEYIKILFEQHRALINDSADEKQVNSIENEIENFGIDINSSADDSLVASYLRYRAKKLEALISLNKIPNIEKEYNLFKSFISSEKYKTNKGVFAKGLSDLIIKITNPILISLDNQHIFSLENVNSYFDVIKNIQFDHERKIREKELLYNFGVILTIARQYEEAINVFNSYLDIDQTSVLTDDYFHFYLAICHKELGKHDYAIRDIKIAIENIEKENKSNLNKPSVPQDYSNRLYFQVLFKWLHDQNVQPSKKRISSYINNLFFRYNQDDSVIRTEIISHNITNQNIDYVNNYFINFKSKESIQDPISEIQNSLKINQSLLVFDIASYAGNKTSFTVNISKSSVNFEFLDILESNGSRMRNLDFSQILNREFLLGDKSEIFVVFSNAHPLLNIRQLDEKFNNKQITYLSNLSSFFKTNYEYPIRSNKVHLFGNPSFGSETEDHGINNFAAIDHISTSRGDFNNYSWPQLPYTKNEIISIDSILSRYNYEITTHLNTQSSEKEFRSIQHPEILHIATHGFHETLDSLYIRPGLVFSNANKSITIDPALENDGYLNPDDLNNIPLASTKLVVLSACDSGVRDTDEKFTNFTEVLFKKGVENVIVTLDVIDDSATRDFMTTFYSYMVQLNNIRLAFDKTEDYMKEKYTDPKYWNNFILISKYRESSLF